MLRKIDQKEVSRKLINTSSFNSFMRLDIGRLVVTSILGRIFQSNVTFTYANTFVLDVNFYVFTQMRDPSGCDIGI